MLLADKEAVKLRTQLRMLEIRSREMFLYVDNCRAVGTASTVLAGLAFFGLVYTDQDYFKDSHEIAKFCYCLSNTVAMCCGLLVAMACTAITMLGPGLALRGPEGSMNRAVDGMLLEFDQVSVLFHFTVVAFLGVCISYAWLDASVSVYCSTILTVLCLVVQYAVVEQVQALEGTFPLRTIALVSGKFSAGVGHQFGVDMGVHAESARPAHAERLRVERPHRSEQPPSAEATLGGISEDEIATAHCAPAASSIGGEHPHLATGVGILGAPAACRTDQPAAHALRSVHSRPAQKGRRRQRSNLFFHDLPITSMH
mmetsp:Transcript_41606/g.97354  ORF Transcript_41606/g.97354 Transcript_41606/m.97354 type:complete len:313 (-) Transcript_41606:563-1501(-)